jgi:hypothetical protein
MVEVMNTREKTWREDGRERGRKGGYEKGRESGWHVQGLNSLIAAALCHCMTLSLTHSPWG